MTRLQADFKDFLSLLNAHRVEYLLIGGYAVGYHGYPRATVDLDVWVAMTPDNAARVLAALRQFGFADPVLTTSLFLKADQIVRMGPCGSSDTSAAKNSSPVAWLCQETGTLPSRVVRHYFAQPDAALVLLS